MLREVIRQRAPAIVVRPLPRMLAVLVCLMAGILLADTFLWTDWYLAPALGAVMALLALRLGRQARWRLAIFLLLLCCLALLLGGMRSWWGKVPPSADHLLYHLSGERVDFVGLIVAPPRLQRRAVVLTVEAERLLSPAAKAATKIGRPRVDTAVHGRVLVKVYESWAYVRYGDRIAVRNVILKRPHRFNNPGEFDYQRYLNSRRIFVRAGVSSWLRVDILARDQGTWLRTRLAVAKRRMGRLLDWQVGGPAADVMRAVLLGERGRLRSDQVQRFTNSGIAHLLAVSGLHVGFVSLACFAALRALLALMNAWLAARWAYCFSTRRVAAFLAIWPTFLYAMLVGYRVSTARAAILTITYLAALTLDRKRCIFHSLAIAAIAVLLWMPGSIYEAGFHLSFAAVLGIALVVEGWRRREALDPFLQAGLEQPSPWRRRATLIVLVTVTAWLVTLPIVAYHFGAIHPWGVVTNVIAVPLATLAVPSGLLGLVLGLVSPLLSWLPLHVSALLIKLIMALSGVIEALPGAALQVVTPPVAALLLAYLGIALLGLGLWRVWLPELDGFRRVWRWSGLAALLAMVAVALPPYLPRGPIGILRVTFLSVGQGDAALAELPDGRLLLVDAGNRWDSGFDAGTFIIAPYLRYRGIRRVDIAVATHRDPDHIGGLPSILQRYGVRQVWTNSSSIRNWSTYALKLAVRRAGASLRVLEEGTRIALGPDTYIDVLNPRADLPADQLGRLRSENDYSLVLRLVYKKTSVLFTSDIEKRTERRLLTSPARLASTILKVPHHGSRTSSTDAFLSAVRPQVAIASAGYLNRYGHPAPEVVRRYARRGITFYSTARHGAVIVESDGRDIRVAPTVMHPLPQTHPAPPDSPVRRPLLLAGRDATPSPSSTP